MSLPQDSTFPYPLPAGTRVVLEVPKLGGGFECITPTAQEFATHVAALISTHVAALIATAVPSSTLAPDTTQVCAACHQSKTQDPRGRWRCTACHSQKMRDSWARRRAV